MKTPIQILLISTFLLALFSCNEAKVEEQQITPDKKQSQASEPVAQQNGQTNSDKSVDKIIEKKWDDAKVSTKKALQQNKEAGEAIWEASKESYKKIWSESKETGGEILGDVKEKSGEILDDVKEKSSKLLEKSNEALKGFIDDKTKDENAQPSDGDEI